MQALLAIIALIFSMMSFLVLYITIKDLFFKKAVILDRLGNKHRAMIRYAENVPNNGLLYKMKTGRRDKILLEEKYQWIDDNCDLYSDIMAQKRSYPPYDKIKVKIR